jgi:hypothetical protein
VTVEDAANLLIAIAGTPMSGIGSAAAVVRQFSGLKYTRSRLERDPKQWPVFLSLPGMEGLGSDHSFRDGLIALIEAVRHRKLTFKKGKPVRLFQVSVYLNGPRPSAGITIQLNRASVADYGQFAESQADLFSGLQWHQTFSHLTILAVAELLGLEDAPAESKKEGA